MSNESLLLELPSSKTCPTLGDCAFQSAAPYLWNALPSTIILRRQYCEA